MTKKIYFIALLLFSVTLLFAQKIELTSPKSGVVNGTLTFEVETSELKTTDTVTYYINGQPVSSPITTPPYTYKYYTQVIFDSNASLNAIVHDKNGIEIARSNSVELTIKNGDAVMTVSGVNFDDPIKGNMSVEIHVEAPLTEEEIADLISRHQGADKTTEAILVFIDGKLYDGIQFGTHTITKVIDTTKLSNGEHELYITAWAFKQNTPPMAQFSAKFTVENEKSPIGLLGCDDIYIYNSISNTFILPLSFRYNDGTASGLFVDEVLSLSVTNEDLITSDIKTSTMLGEGEIYVVSLESKGVEGLVEVNIEAETIHGNFSLTIPVFIREYPTFYHFTKNGKIVTEYDPENSLYITNMFSLHATDITTNPDLFREVKEAKINTVSTGFFRNPADSGDRDRNFEVWKNSWEPYFDGQINAIKELGLSGMLIGDDFCRTANEMGFVINSPYAKDIITYTFEKARDAGVFTSAEMIDEVSFCWGPTPFPTNPDAWANYNPPTSSNAFEILLNYINSVPDRTPISWPIGGISGNDAAAGWLGDPRVSDFNSHYWDVVEWRRTYSDKGSSYPQVKNAIDRVFYGRYSYVQNDKPTVMLSSVCGPFYFKESEGDKFNPEKDRLRSMGTMQASEMITFQIMYNTIIGGSGIRAYSYDGMWHDERGKQPVGYQGETQTGASPFFEGSDRWQAMSSSFNLINIIEPYLLQPMYSSPAVHPDVKSTVRVGKNSLMFMSINTSETKLTLEMPVAGFGVPESNAENIIRYKLHGATLSTDIVPNNENDNIILKPGETVIYLLVLDGNKAISQPAIKINLPANIIVSGTLTIDVEATSEIEIDRVELYINGELSTNWSSKEEFIYDWDSKTSAKQGKWQSISAIAYDVNGNKSMARTTVFLQN